MTSTSYTAETQGTAEFCKRPGNCMINLHDCGCDLPGGPYYPETKPDLLDHQHNQPKE